MRFLLPILLQILAPCIAAAGATRPPYVDGCQSQNGRFVITAEYDAVKKAWRYLWKDKQSDKTLTGLLTGLPDGQGHFEVAYVHLFLAPDGESFATFNAASWAGIPRQLGKVPERTSAEYRDYAGFRDRIIVYKKTGEIVKRLGIKDILKDSEWDNVHHVQGNLFWLGESPDVVGKSGEPPRMGYRFYRISLDYTTLQLYIAPDRAVQLRAHSQGKKLDTTPRVVRVDLTSGVLLHSDVKSADANKVPVRPFVGEFTHRGEAMKGYVASLDPVRAAGSYKLEPSKK